MTAFQVSAVPHLPVLLIDSDPENRDFLRQEFLERGYAVLEADDCNDAYRVLEAQRVCAVICDVELSRKERKSMLAEVQSERYGNPVVFLLVSSSVLTREEGYGLGADAIFSKPIDPHALISRLTELLLPVTTRWKKRKISDASTKIHSVFASLSNAELGRGGFAFKGDGQPRQMLEGERVEFALDVKDGKVGVLKGTGIVRYVSIDPKLRSQRGWGIEFESLEDDSITGVIRGIEIGKSMPFIPGTLQ